MKRFLEQKTGNALFQQVIGALRPLAEEIIRLSEEANVRRAAVKALPKRQNSVSRP